MFDNFELSPRNTVNTLDGQRSQLEKMTLLTVKDLIYEGNSRSEQQIFTPSTLITLKIVKS
jgi:hypothetical protein